MTHPKRHRRHHRHPHASRSRFAVAGVFIVVALNYFFFQGERPYIADIRKEVMAERALAHRDVVTVPVSFEPKTVIVPEPAPSPVVVPEKVLPLPAWKKNALPFIVPEGVPRIAIIIDDLGEYPQGTHEVIGRTGPLTLSFLPYPKNVAAMAAEGRAAGHEIMMHVPMEATMESKLNTASYVLQDNMDGATMEKVLVRNLNSFDGYVGINNHMGSRLTQNKRAMELVMAHLKSRGLLFVDSRTIGRSVAEKTAAEFGLPHAGRDIFLDDDPKLESVKKMLAEVESRARKHGTAIAIGHPKANTIAALKEWLPTLGEKGFALVPVSAVVTVPAQPQPRE